MQSEFLEVFCDVYIVMVCLLCEVFDYVDLFYGWVLMYFSGWWSWIFVVMVIFCYCILDFECSEIIVVGCEIWLLCWQWGVMNVIFVFIEWELQL